MSDIAQCVGAVEQMKENVVYVFIDASNIWEAQKVKRKLFDYEKLKTFLKKKFETTSIEEAAKKFIYFHLKITFQKN